MKLLLAIISIVLFATESKACVFDGNETFAGTLTPTVAYQTVTNVSNGDYFTLNAICGNTYNFNFCNNGGGAAWDTQISILNATGTVQWQYNDDACGLQSNLTWTPGGNATVQILISQYSCDNTGGSSGATLAYNMIVGASNPAFTIASTGCNTASSTITGDVGGTFSFNPAPGDAAVVNPTTGAITNGTPGATYTVQYTVSCGVNSTQNVTLALAGTPSFTLAVACGGGVATITGSPGGTFAFNPAPGDGAQVSATTGNVTNGVAGTTYFVEYTVCGSSSIESVTVLTDNCWTLNGDAQWITVGGEQCIQLTDEINNQTGCAWNGAQIDFTSSFSLTLDYYFGNNINGADGNTFTFQPSASTACGQNGGQLGGGGIANALVIEFDTYDNDNPAHVYDMSCDHVAVEIDGNLNSGVPLCGPVCAKPFGSNIDDGNVYQVDITWDPSTNTLEVYFNGVLRITCVNDFITNAFGGASQVYWGATSATGGLNNQQYFCPSTVVILPVELSSFESACSGEEEVFAWTTLSEDRVDYFQLEYSYDGLVFIHEEKVEAVGMSQSEQNYAVSVKSDDPKQRYYRLKIVDEDGKFEYTDLIASDRCAYTNELISGIYQDANSMTITTHEEVEITVLNQLGQTIYLGSTTNNTAQMNTQNITAGVYFILAKNANGIQQSKKVFVHN